MLSDKEISIRKADFIRRQRGVVEQCENEEILTKNIEGCLMIITKLVDDPITSEILNHAGLMYKVVRDRMAELGVDTQKYDEQFNALMFHGKINNYQN